MKNTCFGMIILFVLTACNPYSPELKEALELAGNNRSELETVLNHFKDRGKVPYKSACFLITNMRYHESKDKILMDNLYNSYFSQTDSLYKVMFSGMSLYEQRQYKGREYDSLRQTLGDNFNALPNPEIKSEVYISDLQTIHADFLIDNIEEALRVWEANGYTFEEDFDFSKSLSFHTVLLMNLLRINAVKYVKCTRLY